MLTSNTFSPKHVFLLLELAILNGLHSIHTEEEEKERDKDGEREMVL